MKSFLIPINALDHNNIQKIKRFSPINFINTFWILRDDCFIAFSFDSHNYLKKLLDTLNVNREFVIIIYDMLDSNDINAKLNDLEKLNNRVLKINRKNKIQKIIKN
jgi:hypothetical protein